jgi:hypothetical protein
MIFVIVILLSLVVEWKSHFIVISGTMHKWWKPIFIPKCGIFHSNVIMQILITQQYDNLHVMGDYFRRIFTQGFHFNFIFWRITVLVRSSYYYSTIIYMIYYFYFWCRCFLLSKLFPFSYFYHIFAKSLSFILIFYYCPVLFHLLVKVAFWFWPIFS